MDAPRDSSLRRRGQTMVLFALTLMLLALMVLVTLSIGARVSERIELQTMADASAYSNAVASARAFNSISLMNRTQISHMAVASGLESVINFSSAYYAHVAMALQLWLSFGRGCTVDPNTCIVSCYTGGGTGCEREVRRAIEAGAQGVANELCRVQAGFPGKDAAAAAEVLLAVNQAFALHQVEKDVYARLQSDVLAKQKLASLIAQGSRAAEVFAPPGVDAITLRELQGGNGCTGQGAACEEGYHLSHSYYAAMGTRGSGFITGRAGARGMMNAQLIYKPWPLAAAAVTEGGVLDLADAPVKQALGSAYFDNALPSHATVANGRALSADDHGLQSADFAYHVPDENMPGFCCLPVGPNEPGVPPCRGRTEPDEEYRNYVRSGELQTFSHLRSTDSNDPSDLHEWGRRIGNSRFIPLLVSDTGAAGIHSTLGCTKDCPGIWPLFTDYNQNLVTRAEDLFGQPKNYALIQRDYAARPPDPWNLFFRFQLSSGTSSVFDNRGLRANGADISKQNAFATGLAYYHRMGHWKEPPNFLNPYWRATLVPWDADAQGQGKDVPDLLRAAGAPEAARSIELLRNQGFKGAH